MHKEFYSFVSTLPNPLGKQEQELLLYEMSKLKEYIALNYPQSFPSFSAEVKKLVFKNTEERESILSGDAPVK